MSENIFIGLSVIPVSRCDTPPVTFTAALTATYVHTVILSIGECSLKFPPVRYNTNTPLIRTGVTRVAHR